ncbi:MAG: RNA-binding S4 domain-containing protein, partial [Flavobacteriales bacterium]
TRSLASKACSAEKVKLNGEFAKSSKIVSAGLVVSIKVNPIWRSYKVIDLPKSRVGAKLISQFIIETTSPKESYQLEQNELKSSYSIFDTALD